MSPEEIARFIEGSEGDGTVLIGPLVDREEVGRYCIIVTGFLNAIVADQVVVGDEAGYWQVVKALPGAIVVDDELVLAQLAEALWPGEQSSTIRMAVEAERGAA
jgi:hypothetical protein